ncbi:MAG: hypothetical protein HC888_11765 [Candidatus Competibacteraceae bacterium]|nr:hypothetical protein [Candidatus Competibacteraceae bacterium]
MKKVIAEVPAAWRLYSQMQNDPPKQVVNGFVDAIAEVATSLEDAEQWLNATATNYHLNPNILISNLYRKLNLSYILEN